jgi:hypothetical protein
MAKIPRKNQKLFGSSASVNQVAKFGSLAAGAPVRYDGTADPDNIQALSNFLSGMFGATLGNNSPAEEDINALFFLAFYQLAYMFQSGVPEWNTSTTYFIGSMVSDGINQIYVSITDNNTGNALSSSSNWQLKSGVGGSFKTVTGTGTVATLSDDFIRGDTSGGVVTVTLPAVASTKGKSMILKNVGIAGNDMTIQANAAELIDGVNTFVLGGVPGAMESVTLFCNGTTWDII